jgi:hypothetical protein
MENNENREQDIITKEIEELRAIQLEGNERMVTKARNALFWTAGLLFFWEMVGMARAGEGINFYIIGFALVVSSVFLGLAFYTKKKPYTAVVLGLVCFIGYWILIAGLNVWVDGAEGFVKALFGGIIIKIIILVNLIRALGFAKELQQAKETAY